MPASSSPRRPDHGARGGIARRVAANTASQALADVGGKLAVLALYAVVARELGVAPLGQLTFALSLCILLQIAGLGTDPLLTAEVAKDRTRLSSVFWNTVTIKLFLGAAAAVIIVAVSFVAGFASPVRLALLLITASALIDLFAGSLASVLRGVEDMVPVAGSQFGQRTTTAIAGVVGIIGLGAGLEGVAVAYVLGSAVGFLMLLRALMTRALRPVLSIDLREARTLAIQSLPLGASQTLSAILARADAILLTALTTLTVVGIYGAAYRLIESTFFLGWAFGIAIFPLLSRSGFDTNPTVGRVFALASRLASAGMLPVGAVFVFFPAPIIEAVYGADFAAAVTPTRWLGVVAALNGLAALALYTLYARGRSSAILKICFLALGVNLALNLLLIEPLGATGAAIAMAAAQLVLTLPPMWMAARAVGGLDVTRLCALTLIATTAMGLARLLLGETWPAIVVGLVAYGVALFVAHHQLFRDDTDLIRGWLAQRRVRAGPT